MRLIIFGANGMLGAYFVSYFRKKPEYEVVAVTRAEFDISSETFSELEPFLESIGLNEQTCVVNAVGLIPQRMKGRRKEDYYVVNAAFPHHLSRICKKHNTHLICPTTDCVFSGRKGAYCEHDAHDEISDYGISKSMGEPADATVIRTSIIGEELRNPCSLLEFIRTARGEIQGWDNHLWNGITCLQYAKILDTIITKNLFWNGVRHLFSPTAKTKYELACIIKEVYDVPCTIQKHNTVVPVDKTLTSHHGALFEIPSLEQQIQEQKDYAI